jgi:hypothetical protein
MTDNNHPITPPLELVEQWECEYHHMTYGPDLSIFISEKAARWGADQELDACCKWLPKLPPWSADDLRKHRRPKPPSLKEQALQALYRFDETERHDGLTQEQIAEDFVLIRRALEQLDG